MIKELRAKGLPDLANMSQNELMAYTTELAKRALELDDDNFYLTDRIVKSGGSIYLGGLEDSAEVSFDTSNNTIVLWDRMDDSQFTLTINELQILTGLTQRVEQIMKVKQG